MMNEWIVSSSLLICAVLLGRRFLRGKISLRLQYALWLAVLIRLLLPVQIFTSDFGAGSMAQSVDISEPVRQVYTSAREDDYERAYDAAYSQVVAEYLASSQTYDPVIVEREAAEQAQQTIELDLNKLLCGIWFGGMLVMTAVIAACNIHLGLHLKRSRREYPVPDSLLPVYVTEAVPTPCIFGLFRPAIYLTPEAAGEDGVRSHVLAHELTHYRHWDHIWSVLRSVCLILHWYNPLVWIAAKVSRADAELACDEGALEKLGEQHRADYGRTLIGLTCPDNGSSMFVTATTMTGSTGSIRERIKLLMKRPRNTVLALIAVILVGTIVVGCSFAGAPETTEPVETTGPSVDNDMSYQDQDLPIPEIPVDIFNDDGVLIYPGVEWFMTEDEVLPALGITHNQILASQRSNRNGKVETSYFTVNLSDAFGVSMVLDFMFRAYRPGEELVLTEVYGTFVHEEDFDAVRSVYAYALGETDAQMTPGIEERWDSDVTLRELLGKEGYEILDRCAEAGDDALNIPASYVQWVDNGSKQIIWFTELPIADDPESIDFFNDLLNPGLYRSEADWYPLALTSYYDGPAGIDLFQLFYNGIPGADNTLPPDELAFLEDQPGYEPDFDLVRIPAREMDRVLTEYFGVTLDETAQIGLANFIYNPQSGCYYHSHTDTNLSFRTVYSVEELPNGIWRVLYTSDIGDGEVILRQRDGKWQIASHLPLGDEPADPTAAALASFSTPSNLEALTRLWNGWTGFSENEFVPAFTPEILDCIQASKNTALVYYRRPGEQQIYAAEMMPHEDGWAVTANSLVISKPDDARELTKEEIAQVSAALQPSIIDEERGEGTTNPLACIVNDYYDDVTKLDRSELLAYFPGSTGATEKEFDLLKEKYPDFFGGWTWEDMPIPVHCYDPKDLNSTLGRYADIRWEDLAWDKGLHYLEETGCFYNYTSDFGLLGFHCTGGWVTDDGAVLLSDHSALWLTERNGDYFITAHLPAMTMPTHSSNPMIPADLSDEDAVKAVAEEFLSAYGENIYLYTDNEYDHLTVLAADSDASAFYGSGQSVPMLEYRENIQAVHKMEDYWKQARQEQGITRSDFQAECHFDSITFDGDVATVTVGYAMSFTYDDQPGTTSGLRDDYKLVLVRVDGQWLIAEVSEIGA